MWTAEEQDALKRENERIGFAPNELLPCVDDPSISTPDGYLALLRSVPDGSGLSGFLSALERHVAARGLAPTIASE